MVKEEHLTPVSEPEEITIWKNPIQTLSTLLLCCIEWAGQGWSIIRQRIIAITILLAIILIPHLILGPHTPFIKEIDDFAKFAGWWVGLGILSSIGLGTGLHTFVLYLAPHLAKYAMATYKCKGVPERVESRWNLQHYGSCPPPSQQTPNMSSFDLLMGVYLEALLWGFGTAIGELPPYIVARAARLAGKKEDELKDIEEKEPVTIMDKAKYLIYWSLKKHAFLTVLACASIPNPLFDLAGITCGHFLIPFRTFFIATSIGKALIKTTMQSVFVLNVFYGKKIDVLVVFLESVLPFIGDRLSKQLIKQRATLTSETVSEEGKSILAGIWDIMLTIMIGYFVISLVHSAVNDYRAKHKRNSKEDSKKAK